MDTDRAWHAEMGYCLDMDYKDKILIRNSLYILGIVWITWAVKMQYLLDIGGRNVVISGCGM